MCYNVSVSVSRLKLEQRFSAKFENPALFKPIFHASAFAYPRIPVITSDHADTIQMFQWGLIPAWVKDEQTARKMRAQTCNARAETIHDKPSFKIPIKDHRCLVLVDGFYEWREVNKKKFPYLVYFKDREPFAMAGIWDEWVNPGTKETNHTFSIITTRANTLLEKIHNTKKRMPVILKAGTEPEWLNTDLPVDAIDRLMEPIEDKQLVAHPVSKLITARGQDTNVPRVMDTFHYTELDGL